MEQGVLSSYNEPYLYMCSPDISGTLPDISLTVH